MSEKVIGDIYQTDDYDKFKRLKGNRDVKGAKKIIKSIEKVGVVLSPILVNENYEVIDGQNRLDALRELKKPVAYIIQEGIGINECRALNTGQSNWKTEHFISSYAENGFESYQRLFELVKDFKMKGFGLEGILFMATPKMIPHSGGVAYEKVKTGDYVLTGNRYEIVRRRLTSAIALGFTKFKERYNMLGRAYWGAVAYAYEHQEVNVKELIQKMWDSPLDIIPAGRASDQLRYFDDVYNKGKKAAARVYMSTDFLKEKYLDEEVENEL